MTQIATVEKILPGGMAEISVPRKSACGHDCEECAGCGVSGASVRAVARNDARAEVGQKVVVESSTNITGSIDGIIKRIHLRHNLLTDIGFDDFHARQIFHVILTTGWVCFQSVFFLQSSR